MANERFVSLKECVETGGKDEIIDAITILARESSRQAIDCLRFLLTFKPDGLQKILVPRLVARALIGKGPVGVDVLFLSTLEAPGRIYPAACFQALWFAAKRGRHIPLIVADDDELSDYLNSDISQDTADAAADAVHDLIVSSRTNSDLFQLIIHFINSSDNLLSRNERLHFHEQIFDSFTEASVRLTKRLLLEFEKLIQAKLPESEYQIFLSENPVLIDPLVSQIISKQKLGIEYATDFALQRLDAGWTLVEIEKPQDPIFTKNADFRSEFTHALGQVLDFLEWVAQEEHYAQRFMPGIREPKGLLVMGNRASLSSREILKLERFRKNLNQIDVLTFDDLLVRANSFYTNLRNVRRRQDLTEP